MALPQMADSQNDANTKPRKRWLELRLQREKRMKRMTEGKIDRKRKRK